MRLRCYERRLMAMMEYALRGDIVRFEIDGNDTDAAVQTIREHMENMKDIDGIIPEGETLWGLRLRRASKEIGGYGRALTFEIDAFSADQQRREMDEWFA